MTCRLDAGASVRPAYQRPSGPSLSSLNKILDNSLSENIILWYKDDSQVIGVNSISNDPKKYFIYQESFHTYQLTLINVQLESSGVYKCQNFTAKEENRFQVNVMGMSAAVLLVDNNLAGEREKIAYLVSQINLADSRRLCLLLLEYVKQTQSAVEAIC